MADLAAYVHGLGLKIGIYTDVTTTPCVHGQYPNQSQVPGSWGHYQQDADTFARWGMDYVKADFCNAKLPNGTEIDPTVAYPAFSRALNATGRPMYFLVCYDRWINTSSGLPLSGKRPVWEWAHPVANAYRLGTGSPPTTTTRGPGTAACWPSSPSTPTPPSTRSPAATATLTSSPPAGRAAWRRRHHGNHHHHPPASRTHRGPLTTQLCRTRARTALRPVMPGRGARREMPRRPFTRTRTRSQAASRAAVRLGSGAPT